MVKMSKWSIAGMLSGLVLSIFSGWRYWVMFPDMDRALIYPLIGVLIIAVSWLYNQNLKQSNNITAMEDYLSEKNNEELEKKEELDSQVEEEEKEVVEDGNKVM